MTPLNAAIDLIRRGFFPVPIPDRSKRPVLSGWQQLRITIEMAPQYFNGGPQNIGLLLGDKFGSTDVDCDCPEAITAARQLLPETGLIFGKALQTVLPLPVQARSAGADPTVSGPAGSCHFDRATRVVVGPIDRSADCRSTKRSRKW